ncbi:MAG: hypothetical protein R3190_03470, partial [Thermoanaerobaculia bacterium]|nr:hypothetical protein [Thermoanaerobaculia bacterium]
MQRGKERRRPATTKVAVAVASALAVSCAAPVDDAPVAVRLVDAFGDATVSGEVGYGASIPATEWHFEGADGETPWSADELSDPVVAGGTLSATATSAQPILYAALPHEPDASDLLHEVVIRARVSAGATLHVQFAAGPEVD